MSRAISPEFLADLKEGRLKICDRTGSRGLLSGVSPASKICDRTP